MIPSAVFRNFGAPILLSRLNALVKEIPGVRAGKDAEHVHRMRVASRRLRRALDVFGDCFPAKDVKRWTKRIKRITRDLGAARDLDVQTIFLAKEKRLLSADSRAGIERIILRITQRRIHEQKAVLDTLAKIDEEGTLRSMEESMRIAVSHATLANQPTTDISVRKKAHGRLIGLLANMLSFETYIPQAERSAEHHEMRIAAKFLRYEVEVFESLFGKAVKPYLAKVKELQAILGELHDCDVWIEYLPVFIAHEREQTMSYFGHIRGFSRIEKGIQHLIDDRKKRRRECHAELMKFWDESKHAGTWRSLKDIIDRLITRQPVLHAPHSKPRTTPARSAGKGK